MKLKPLVGVVLIVILVSSCKPKHLFILSGQSNMVHLDPNISFKPALEAEFGKKRIILVKDAIGSQSISQWYKDWESPDGNSPEVAGDLYDSLMLKVKDSIKDKKLASVTFIWMQGERDARMKFAEVYESSLLGLHQQLSKDLNRTDINFIIGRLSDFDMQNEKWPHWTKIRDIQVKVAESQTSFAWVNTDDLNDGINKKGKIIKNDLHLSEDGYKILGERFALKAIQLIKENKD